MINFNKQLTANVSVDEIANQLLAAMNPECEHAEKVVEAIIGSLLNTDKLIYVYNALNGYSNEVDFQVGDMVYCSEKIYQYVAIVESNSAKYEQKYLPISQAVITNIDIYREDKVMIEYSFLNHEGEPKRDTKWVCHLKCIKIISDAQGEYPTVTELD